MTETTPGMELVFGADGRSYWYTGMRSPSQETATVGFALVDSRTKATTIYRLQGGASETTAQRVTEAAVREKNYRATFPVLYNLGNQPTYYLTLKGGDIVHMHAFVSVTNISVYGVAATPRDALAMYQTALSRVGAPVTAEDMVSLVTIDAVVADVVSERTGNDDYYYLLLEGQEGKEFVGVSTASPKLKWTRKGHRVQVKVEEGKLATRRIVSFDNMNINIGDAKR